MQAPNLTTPKWMAKAIPGLDHSTEALREYFERTIDPLSPRRRWHMMDAAERAFFFYGDHWKRKSQMLSPGSGAYHFERVVKKSLASFPQPVTNLVKRAVLNDVARLSKKEYVPEASASKNHPQWIAAANAARDILLAEAQDLLWAPKREETVFNLVLDGTAIVRTYRDELATKMSPIAALNAVHCPQCGLRLASSQVPAAFLADGFPNPTANEMVPIEESMVELPAPGEIPPGMRAYSMRLKACPMCRNEFAPYAPTEEEAAGGFDSLGNPLGEMLPEGENSIEVVSMHDFYPENGGVRIEPHQCRSWNQMSVRSLEWIVQRHPELENELEPEDPVDLLRLDPLYSGEAFLQRSPYGKAGALDSYSNHARYKEAIVAPQNLPGYEAGAWHIQVGKNGTIISKPLCVVVETENGEELVPRCEYHIGRYCRIPGQFWGSTFVHDLIPINKRLNEIDAQGMDLRERGKPMIAAPEGLELTIRDDEEGALQIMEYEESANWDPKSSLFPGVTLNASPYHQERMQCFEDAKYVGAPQDIEMGTSVGGVKTTSGLMLVSEEASQIRGPIERGLIGIYEGVFQHTLDLKKTFDAGGKYERRSEQGFYEIQSWEREDLVGSMKIKVTTRAGFDSVLYNKEATAEAIQMGLLDVSSPVDKERALEAMKLPKNETVGVQIKRAEMAWSEFLKNFRVPVIDETLFNVSVWFDLFGKHWMEDEALMLQRQCDFDGFFARLNGWQDEFAKAEAIDEQQRLYYGSLDPNEWTSRYEQMRIAYEQAKAAQQGLGAPPEQAVPPPPAPPVDGFLPRPLQLRIIAVWERMLGGSFQDALVADQAAQESGIEPAPEREKMRLTVVLLTMRAVIEALALLVQRRQMALVPQAPAPGSPAAPPAG